MLREIAALMTSGMASRLMPVILTLASIAVAAAR